MAVVATAGHVDHGKSSLVKALTGMEPDRWAEERRREMTIDLGYAWTTLPGGPTVAFVDVPGHHRFIGNTLAGLGPAPAVLLVVAADEGWRQQTQEHLAAIDALQLRHGVVVVTRSDLADPEPAMADASRRIAASSLRGAGVVAVSSLTGHGLNQLRTVLAGLLAELPTPDPTGRVRLWLDRSFTIRGAGTVVTGTLAEGAIAVGDTLALSLSTGKERAVRVRGLHSLDRRESRVEPVNRVAVNLRGVGPSEVGRGQTLLTPGAWQTTNRVDVVADLAARDLPSHLTLYCGTAAIPVRMRPLEGHVARLTLSQALPLIAGDRAILRDPGSQQVIGGALVVDADPPDLRRRGSARARGRDLASSTGVIDIESEAKRRGFISRADAQRLGADVSDDAVVQAGLKVAGAGASALLIHVEAWARWVEQVGTAVAKHAADHPLQPAIPASAVGQMLGLPATGFAALLGDLVRAAGLVQTDGRIHRVGDRPSLGDVEVGLRDLEARLAEKPWSAPEKPELDAAGLGPKQVAAAVSSGRLIKLADDVVLLPSAPAQAMRELAALEQPFTTSAARQALGTTRRVVIPLLEHLDDKGWTERVDASHRRVRRPGAARSSD